MEGESAKGIFGGSATGGRAFRAYRRQRGDAVDRFAELVSIHGDVRKVARLMSITYANGSKLMNRLARQLNANEDLGWTREQSAHCRHWDAR